MRSEVERENAAATDHLEMSMGDSHLSIGGEAEEEGASNEQ